jgi:solute carrier family 4 (anion exchanger) protein 1
MCGATVQSMNHVRSMTTTLYNEETQQEDIVDVQETRLSGFVVHAMIALTINLLGLLKYIPVPVFSGLFLYLGRKLMTGNTFLQRLRDSVAERKRLPPDHPIFAIGKVKVSLFTGIQLMCLVGMWLFKQNAATSIFFPSAIGVLMLIRSKVLPRFFTEEEFVALGDPTPAP